MSDQQWAEAAYGFVMPTSYTLLQAIGRGAFGLVVRAKVNPGSLRPDNAYFTNRETDCVAVKKLAATTVYRDGYHAKQVYREITLLKQLQHPNLIKLVDLFASPGLQDLYIVTEAMDCDLSSMIQGVFEFIEPHIMFIVYQVLRGLSYMHAAGVLHRDLKPQNILVNQSLEARICDLGLARVKSPGGEAATGYVTTRWYRAPEVMLTWQHYTYALDIWSVGCIFGELLNRLHRRPTFTDPRNGDQYYAVFPADSHVDHLRAILETLGVPPAHIIDSITEAPIKKFVTSKAAEINHRDASVSRTFAFAGELAVDLLSGLLLYDPAGRLTAETAIVHPYLSSERDPLAEFTRSPINTAFEALDLPVDTWRQMIAEEISQMQVIQDGYAPGSFVDVDEEPAHDAFEFGAIPLVPSDSLIRANMDAMNATVAALAAEREYVQQLALSPDSEAHRVQLLEALGEFDARLGLYADAMHDPSLSSS